MVPPFPKLHGSQVVLVRAEIKTGHVLDENFRISISQNQNVYTIFENIDLAISAAKLIVNKRRDVECNLYDKDDKFLQVITFE